MWEERWISLKEKIKSKVRLTVSHHSWRKNVVWDHAQNVLPLISLNYLIRRSFSLPLLFSFSFRHFLLADALRSKLVKFLHPCHFLSCLTRLPHLCPPSFPSSHHHSSLLYSFFVLHFILPQDSIPFPILLCFISQKEKRQLLILSQSYLISGRV